MIKIAIFILIVAGLFVISWAGDKRKFQKSLKAGDRVTVKFNEIDVSGEVKIRDGNEVIIEHNCDKIRCPNLRVNISLCRPC